VGDYGGRVRAIDLREQEAPTTWDNQGRMVGLAFAPDDGLLAWASYSGFVLCFFPGTKTFHNVSGPTPRPFCLALSPDGCEAAVGSKCGEVMLLRTQATADVSLDVRMLSHGSEQGCWGLSYSPDGRSLALALGDGAQVWDRFEGRMLLKQSGHEDVVSGVAFSPDGRRLATCSWDGTVRLYDVTAGMTLVASYDWKIGRLFCVAFSPDSTLAAVGGDQNGGLVAWDVE
jgi:WD40 repeat protein